MNTAAGGVFVIEGDGTLSELTERPYDSEGVLQELLERYPRLLAGDLIDPEVPRRWVLISREMGLPSGHDEGNRWAIDHLFVDQDAIPTVVEVKRSSDTRIRREVVGQILEYAANGVSYWDSDTLRARFEEACRRRGLEPASELAALGGEMIDADQFWDRLATNLRAGRIRLILVADEIPGEVKRIVEFLNEQMSPAEILAVEVRQFVAGDLRTLVPRVFGQTEQAQTRKRGTRPARPWEETSFFAELERRSPDSVPVARAILDWIRPLVARVWWGRGSTQGSFVPVVTAHGLDYQLFAVWTYGSLEFYFQYYAKRPAFESIEQRRALRDRLNLAPGMSLDESALSRRPSVPLSAFRDPEAMRVLRDTYAWFLEQVTGPRDE